MAQDGAWGGINFDASDRFCMDGQRLVAISGTYGADGTQYRTEVETFSKIISHGSAGSGPVWFEVHTKSGQTMELGNTSDSRILAVGKTSARVWAVSKVSDSKSNYFAVTYTNDTTNGQFYPSRIDYTGNSATSVSPYNSVQFVYATRPDIIPQFQAGSLIKTTVRLTSIKMYAGPTSVTDFRLSYQTSAMASLLASVTACDAASICLPSSSFGWMAGTTGQYTVAYSQANGNGPFWRGGADGFMTYVADVNGDGRADVIQLNSAAFNAEVLLSNGDGTFRALAAGPSARSS